MRSITSRIVHLPLYTFILKLLIIFQGMLSNQLLKASHFPEVKMCTKKSDTHLNNESMTHAKTCMFAAFSKFLSTINSLCGQKY